MVRIVSDTSTLYSTAQAREAGFAVSPLAVTIAGESYRELDEMTPERFVEIIAEGNMPASSQPAIGEVMDLYQEYAGEEIINISIADFDYLRRGGRLSPLVSLVGKTIKLAPVLTQSEDGRQLVMSAVKRSYKLALQHVAQKLAEHGVGKGWRIYITHAVHEQRCLEAKAVMEAAFPEATIECYTLTPAFITQGGPSCVAVQVVREI